MYIIFASVKAHGSILLNTVPNVQGSDTTEDAM